VIGPPPLSHGVKFTLNPCRRFRDQCGSAWFVRLSAEALRFPPHLTGFTAGKTADGAWVDALDVGTSRWPLASKTGGGSPLPGKAGDPDSSKNFSPRLGGRSKSPGRTSESTSGIGPRCLGQVDHQPRQPCSDGIVSWCAGDRRTRSPRVARGSLGGTVQMVVRLARENPTWAIAGSTGSFRPWGSTWRQQASGTSSTAAHDPCPGCHSSAGSGP
jgi:hypothetical protein